MNEFFTEIDEEGNEFIYKRDRDLVWSIPKDPANSDYQAYLKSLEEGTIS